MYRQQLIKFLSAHHLKLWACGLGVLVAMSLAAATPSLTSNSVAAGPYQPAHIGTKGLNNSQIKPASSGTISTSPVQVQSAGSSSGQAAAASDTAPVYPGYKCSMTEGAQSAGGACGCGGRGTELMCPMPE